MRLQLPSYLRWTIILLGILLAVTLLERFDTLFIPLALSLLFALILHKPTSWLRKRGVTRTLAVLLSILAAFSVLLGVVFVVSGQFVQFSDEVPEISSRLEMHLENLKIWVFERFGVSPERQISWLEQASDRLLEASGGIADSLFQSTTTFFSGAVLIPVYVFFFLYYKDHFKRFVYDMRGLEQREETTELMESIKSVVQSYLNGMLLVMAIVAVLNVTGMLLIGLNHAVFFGLLAALLTIIPYIGVFIGSALPTLYSLAMSDSLVQPALVFGTFTLIQNLEGYLITPNIVGGKVNLNPMSAMLALLIGAQIWGIAGMIMFVPFVAVFKVMCDHLPKMEAFGRLLGDAPPELIPRKPSG